MPQIPVIFRRVLKRLGPKAALQVIFDKEAGMNKAAIALKYHISPSYLTELFQQLDGFTTYAIPQEFLLAEGGEEALASLSGSRERAAYLMAAGIRPVSPERAAEYAVTLPDEKQFAFILNPTLRATAYWAHHDMRGHLA